MEKLTYKQAYDKIIEAYFKDEIKPMKPRFCFCGTLNNNVSGWQYQDGLSYSVKEFGRMEKALFSPFTELGYSSVGSIDDNCLWDGDKENPITTLPNYEDRLFKGMCAALEVLKQIHKERGEDVDGVQEFTKRKLQTI